MIPLNQIQVPKPCGENWDAMEGNTQRRFCAGCRCHVHDLSAMTSTEAQSLLDRADGRLCVRFQTRPDGTVLTQDAPACVENRVFWPRHLAAAVSWALALVVAGLGLPARAETVLKAAPHASPKAHATAPGSRHPRVTVGKLAVPRPLPMYTTGIVAMPRVPSPPPPATMGTPLTPPKKSVGPPPA